MFHNISFVYNYLNTSSDEYIQEAFKATGEVSTENFCSYIGLHFCSFQRERERKRGREREKERGRHHECQMSCKIIYTLTPPFSGGP